MIKLKNYWMAIIMAVLSIVSLVSCSSDEVTLRDVDLLQKTEGIIKLKGNIGTWDAAYLTKYGYFCQKNSLKNSSDSYSDSKYGSLSYMSADKSEMLSLITTRDNHMPTQMVTKAGVIYFSFPNDSILELLFDDGKTISMLDSIPYSTEKIKSLVIKDDDFKSVVSIASYLLNNYSSRANNGSDITNAYGKLFAEVGDESYTENDEVASGIATTETGEYQFSEEVSDWYEEEIGEYVCNTLSLWTGKATYKVGGSSCTLSGTIWCPSNEYNQYGTYGILCDENTANLYVNNAEYEDTGFQSEDDLSFSVDFRGLKPNTTYYYRSFYKFNSLDHGNIIPKYGDANDQVIYDPTIKSFTTGDNSLTVDVVMCIDVTGSMSDIINTVKRNAIGFYDSFNQCCQEEGIQLTGLNAQVIAFRDKNEDSNWLQSSSTFNLPSQQSQFNSFVSSLRADGGGDTPESGLEALEAAFNKVDWGEDDGYHRQVVILWTDADYLIGSYSNVSIASLESKWNSMPSGRRLILFAPYGTFDSNGGSWGNLDSWKNVIHEDDLYSGFNNFEYILKSIIGELTSRSSRSIVKRVNSDNIFFRPNN